MTSLILNKTGTTAFDKIIDRPLNDLGKFLDSQPTIYKVIVAANHFFRAAMMWTFTAMMPFTPATSFVLGFGASLGYRATIERFCQFRFAVLSCLGAFAYHLSAPSLALIVNGLALASFKAFALALLGAVPAILYLLTVVYVSSTSVNDYVNSKSSCCGESLLSNFPTSPAPFAADAGSCCSESKEGTEAKRPSPIDVT